MSILEYTEVHSHTEYSNIRLIDCINKAKDSVRYAYDIGLSGLAITDHECVSSHIKAIQEFETIKKENPDTNFKLILGNEIYLVDRAKENLDDKLKYYHFILLAKNKKGHEVLRKLSSKAWENSYYDRRLERVPTLKSWVEEIKDEIRGNIIGSTSCLGSEFAQLCLELSRCEDEDEKNNIKWKIDDFLTWCIDIFGKDNFYIEIQPSDAEEQIAYNELAIFIAKHYNLKFIVSNDVHYLNKHDRDIHSSFLKSKEEERETEDFYKSTYFRTSLEILESFKPFLDEEDVITAIENTMDIHNKIESYSLYQDIIVPQRKIGSFNLGHIFKEWYNKYIHINVYANSEIEQDRFLLHQIEKGFIELNQEFNEENLARIDIELKQLYEISKELNQSLGSYYTLVQWLVDIMWDDNLGNSLVGVARGSGAGFYICYLLKISQANPIEHNLPYWRHLNSSRVTMSDIDLDSEASRRPFIFDAVKKEVGYDNALNIATFKTEGSKSAILCSARGLGINSDEAQEIVSLIPSERGFLWSLKDCFEGNEEKNRKPIAQMVNLTKHHSKLKETSMRIEGLVTARSSHACGFYIFQNGYVTQNALMKTPSGQLITQFDMDDSDSMGGLKVDFLTVKALDKMRKAMELLLKDNLIVWQGSLRKTYDKYFHPDAIDFTDEDMWDNICEAKIMDLFQFETQVGSQAIKMLQPRTLKEISIGNSAMRLMPPEGSDETPLETFVKYKNDIDLWYEKAKRWGLNNSEISTIEKYLKENYMMAIEQEDIMKISMDENVVNFDLRSADKLRKAVAKKKADVLKEVKTLFFQRGNEIGIRKVFLKFVWEEIIMLQAGYGFSALHSLVYSMIGLQEAWIYTKYHSVYWNTSCLTVNASAGDEEVFDNEKSKTTNYGKIAKAIGDIQKRGIDVVLPNINKSDYEFTPDSQNNRIIYGLIPISGINSDIAKDMIANRPYISLEDFHNRLTLERKKTTDSSGKEKSTSLIPSGKVITLIKSGAFDSICGEDRVQIMKDYINLIHPPKTKLNFQNFDSLVDLDLVPEDLSLDVRIYKFYKFVTNKKNIIENDSNTKSKKWFNINENDSINSIVELFFEENFIHELKEGEDYRYELDGTLSIFSGASSCKFDKLVKEKYNKLTNWLSSKDCVKAYNDKMFEIQWNKYTGGSDNISKWEMESVVYYYHQHELYSVDREKYSISNFFELPDEPNIVGYNKYKNIEYPKYELSRICGTVLDRDTTRHIVTILVPDGGTVSVKYQAGQFSSYDKQISYLDEDGKKVVVESGWFVRGRKLLISGYKMNGIFRAKKYKDSIWSRSTILIEDIDENGNLTLKSERSKV